MNRGTRETDRRGSFGRLCESLRPDLLRFAFWLGRDRQLAEDAVQEALLRAWKSYDTLEDEGKAKSWLLTIVRRELARTFERRRPEVTDLDALVAAESGVLAAQDEGDDLRAMREALFRLEDEYREPLVMQVLIGYSTKEIADLLGMQQGAVLTRLFRARARLRRALGLAREGAEWWTAWSSAARSAPIPRSRARRSPPTAAAVLPARTTRTSCARWTRSSGARSRWT